MSKILISLCKKKKSNRSSFLSVLMRAISGDAGERVVSTFFGRDRQAFIDALSDVTKNISNQMPNIEK